MFSSDAITTRLIDLSCPMSRDIKVDGWCRIQPPCPKRACLFCDLLEACHGSYGKNFQNGYLSWPKGMTGSLMNLVRWLHWSQAPLFNMEKLPQDLKHYMLHFMLVSDEPITNPFLQNVVADNGPIKYSWSNFMRPNLIATNTEYYEIGMRMLYKYNTFRFTRLVAQASNRWSTHISVRFQNSTPFHLLDDFLSSPHITILDPKPRLVRRSTLLDKVILQDSDLDCDKSAKRGISNLCAAVPQIDRQRFLYFQISKLARWGVDLSTLVITVDQEEPGVLNVLSFECCRLVQHVVTEENQAKSQARFRDTSKIFTKNWSLVSTKADFKGLKVANVLVRGTDIFAGGKMNFIPKPTPDYTTDKSDKKSVKDKEETSQPFVCSPTNKVAKAIIDYFDNSMKGGYSKNIPRISFTGRFHDRRIKREDGSWLSDRDYALWNKRILKHMSNVVMIARALEAKR